MRHSYDAIVVGLGAMGAAALHALAGRGLRVLGLERFDLGHDRGSSHGGTRVIRKAYFEDSRYVPLLHRAYEGWRALEAASGETLLHLCGGINIGPPDHVAIRGVLASAAQHALPHEVLSAADVTRRFPALRPSEGDIGVYEADAGFVPPERCVLAFIEGALRRGADVRAPARVQRVVAGESVVRVFVDDDAFEAGALVLAAGPWMDEMVRRIEGGDADWRGQAEIGARSAVSGAAFPLVVERQAQFWFQPRHPAWFEPGRMPVFIQFTDEGAFYGLPHAARPGVKICRHHGGPATDPDTVRRGLDRGDLAVLHRFIERHVPDAYSPPIGHRVCLYTNTPDGHFLLGRHPRAPRVVVAGGGSGHAFKFAPVIGEIAADLATSGATLHDIAMFDPARFDHSGVA